MELVVIILLWLGLTAEDERIKTSPPIQEVVYEDTLCFVGRAMVPCRRATTNEY